MKKYKTDERNQRNFKYMEKHSMYMTRCNIIKMLVPPMLIYTLQAFPMKILANCFVNTDKLNLKFIWKGKKSKKSTQ